MEKHPTYNFISDKYTTEIRAVVADFEIRFGDFRKIENLVQFISYPFNDSIDHSDIYELATKFTDTFQMEPMMLQNEIITLRCDIFLKARSSSGQDFWALVSNEKYRNLKKCVEQLHSCFGSTYLCESAFSYLKQTKSKHRSRLTDAHTLDSLRLAISNYKPDYAKLVEDRYSDAMLTLILFVNK